MNPRIEYDRTRMADDARQAQKHLSTNSWNDTYSACPRCGTWCHWKDSSRDGCPTCKGYEVK